MDRRERGFVLAAALIIAVLYLALMELLLMDSTRALNEAQRYRSQVIAQTLAESGAERAAAQMIAKSSNSANAENWQGTMTGTMQRAGNNFEIIGDGVATGVPPAKAHVELKGAVFGTHIQIDFATHTP
jgi:Tfp pilus assembly protein PilV